MVTFVFRDLLLGPFIRSPILLLTLLHFTAFIKAAAHFTRKFNADHIRRPVGPYHSIDYFNGLRHSSTHHWVGNLLNITERQSVFPPFRLSAAVVAVNGGTGLIISLPAFQKRNQSLHGLYGKISKFTERQRQ